MIIHISDPFIFEMSKPPTVPVGHNDATGPYALKCPNAAPVVLKPSSASPFPQEPRTIPGRGYYAPNSCGQPTLKEEIPRSPLADKK